VIVRPHELFVRIDHADKDDIVLLEGRRVRGNVETIREIDRAPERRLAFSVSDGVATAAQVRDDDTHRFDVAPDAPPFKEDDIVFVGVVNADEELMWTDDHYPPTPTSAVEAGTDDYLYAHDLRPDLSVHGGGGDPHGALFAVDEEAPSAHRPGHGPVGV